MKDAFDAIVVGAGVIGASVGLALARRGWRTLNLDKNAAAGAGSSGSTSAIVRFHYSTTEGCAMARESYYHWLDWSRFLGASDDMGTAAYVNTGCLVFKHDGNDRLSRVVRALDELRIPFEHLTTSDLQRQFPWLDPRKFGPPTTPDDDCFGEPTGGDVPGAIFLPESGYVDDAVLACHNLQRACEAHGGRFRFGAEVVEIVREGGRAAGVRLADGCRVSARVVVNAAGPHSSAVNRMARVLEDMNVRTRPLKQEVCYVAAPPGIDYERVAPLVSDGDTGCYFRPAAGNQILIGSEQPDCDPVDWVEGPDDYNRGFTGQWHTQVVRAAQRIRNLGIPARPAGVVDLYDVTEDWIPIYDKSSLPGFYMAAGTSGNQFKNAPVAGGLMAEIVEQVEGGRDHDRDPVQVPLPYVRRTCNAGFFSRLRKANTESSSTVLG